MFDQKKEARRWATATENAINENKVVDTGRMRFADLIDAYITEHGSMGRSKTSAIKMLRERLGRHRMAELTRTKPVLDFAGERREEGAGPATIGQDLGYLGTILRASPALIDLDTTQQLTALASAREWLRTRGKITATDQRNRRPTDAELMRLFEFWRRQTQQVIPMEDITLFAVATAMRISEITRLTWSDLDETKRTILIRDRKDPRKKIGNHQEVPLLTGPFRLNGQLIYPMAIILRQPRQQDRIFPYLAASVSSSFQRAAKSTGIADLRFHDLRHDAVSRLFEAKYSIEQVALVSGHKDWRHLRRYTQLRAEDMHRDENVAGSNIVNLHR
ncbi:MAG: site-specific integrase [Alphaproteobacteria bacterium]|nr:site-specific integrase [Alphaproteobacteria bacterium]